MGWALLSQPDLAPFREKLRSAGFYSEWKGKYGEEAWAILEKFSLQIVQFVVSVVLGIAAAVLGQWVGEQISGS